MRSKILAALLTIPLLAAGTVWALAATLPQKASAQAASGEAQLIRISDSRFVLHDGERLVLYVLTGGATNTASTYLTTCVIVPNLNTQYPCR